MKLSCSGRPFLPPLWYAYNLCPTLQNNLCSSSTLTCQTSIIVAGVVGANSRPYLLRWWSCSSPTGPIARRTYCMIEETLKNNKTPYKGQSNIPTIVSNVERLSSYRRFHKCPLQEVIPFWDGHLLEAPLHGLYLK